MIDPQLILGIASGGIGALIQLKKQADQDRHDITMAVMTKSNDIANAAHKRSSPWSRRFAMIVVLSVGFGGLLYAAHMGIEVSQIVKVDPIFKFLGLSIGGGEKVVQATGFVIPQYVENSILSIIFFLFGSSAAKR